MDLFRAKAALCRLLSCNIDQFEFGDLKVLVSRRKLLWHPNKNRDKHNPYQFAEQLIELKEAWKVFLASKTGKQGNSSVHSRSEGFNFKSYTQSEPDFICYESSSSNDSPSKRPTPQSDPEPDSDDPSWEKWDRRRRAKRDDKYFAEKKAREEREATPEYNETPFDEEFFVPSTPKKFAVPDGMRAYFRSASNRRAGKFFSLFSSESNQGTVMQLYRRFANQLSYFGMYGMRTDEDLVCILMLLTSDYRLADVKKECRKLGISPVEAFYATKVGKCIEFCKEKYGQPKEEPVKYSGNASTPDHSKKMNYKMLSDFAVANEITDPYELMYDYAHLSTGCDRSPSKITNEHESDHVEHLDNARHFEHFSDKKRIAKNAVESVIAKLLVQSRRESNLQYVNRRCKEIGNRIQDNFSMEDVGEAWFYCSEIIHDFRTISQHILNAFIYGKPRERYVALKGTFKSGKTSFASAWCQLLEGTNINVNVDKGRLPFYLGQAIGKRFILFDDVKGRSLGSENLPSGPGFANLDDLRDHIDGHVEVQLEKKNTQPISQVFPCGIITCNDYHIHQSLKERIIGPIEMKASPLFPFHAAQRITEETIFIGLVLYNLLPAEAHILEFLYKNKSKWESQHMQSNCNCLNVSRQQ
ncbi:Large T antigen, partial [Araneus ventricosus]